MIDIKQVATRFVCDERFFIAISHVLDGIPQNISERLINRQTFQIISMREEEAGLCFEFLHKIKHLILLNGRILYQPFYYITHIIAHEIAHMILKHEGPKNDPAIEKEADDQELKWGFEFEYHTYSNIKPLIENPGCKVGEFWAIQIPEVALDNLNTHLKAWDWARHHETVFKQLLKDLDVSTIIGKGYVLKAERENDEYTFDKAFVHGIMALLKCRLLDGPDWKEKYGALLRAPSAP
jgi:hypothetical protein